MPGSSSEDLGTYLLETTAVLVWLTIAVLYVLAGRAAALRGHDGWPVHRSAAWLAGAGLGLAATAGPLAREAARSFTTHTVVHLLLGMLVPLLLVLGAPMTLFLRAVSARTGRRVSRLARTAPLRLLAHPVTATALTTVPMALLYWNGTGLVLLHDPLLGPLLHLHFVASGALFAYSVIGRDPNPHRAAVWVRGSMIALSIAVHGMVAKHLYSVSGQAALPPDTEQAAQLMYYGGDAVHVLLLMVFCAQIYRSSGRRLRRDGIRGLASHS